MKNKLVVIRKLHKERQGVVASKLGVSQSAYIGYETGRNVMPTDVLRRFCVLYDVSSDWMFGFTEKSTWQTKGDLASQIDLSRNAAVEAIKILKELEGKTK
jgi:DNA-binding XRE family transcriptional regulator